jgi:alpha-L-fucosidase
LAAKLIPVEDWFTAAGLGMFVHWDHASQQGLELSWPLVGGVFALPRGQSVPVEQYHSSAATFDPTNWDPAALAAAARAAGMRYAVFTTKHHSGYSMFHTKHSRFSIEHSPYRRDLVREFVDAMRGEGLKVGLYYSLSDWSHPDYPPFTDADRPYRFGMVPPKPPDDVWARYLDFLFGQVEELLGSYGPIDVIWFDGGWERTPEQWRARELAARIRELQPHILINDRLPGQGDYDTPEQFVPSVPPPRPWETCMTMNESWGWNPSDMGYKSARALVHTLCEVRGRGGNLLLNVSPTGDGSLPPQQRERLAELARWMDVNHEAVHDVTPGLEPWQFYGPTTRRGDRVYLHLLMRPYETVTVRGVHVDRVRDASVLGSDASLDWDRRIGVLDRLVTDPVGELVITVPERLLDPTATVVALDFENGPT